MAWKLFLSLAAAAFAAILFRLFLRRGDRARPMEESAKRRCVCENDGTARGASSTHASTEGQEVATSSGYDYEVFLSFRGPDTRAGFTNFLYTSMIDMGIRAYKDDEDLRTGEEFGPALLQAIEQSRISIPIFSKGYASSVWCLKELVKMVECRKTKGQKIMPIFYDVSPAEVRYQTGGYKEAFDLHKNKNRHDEGTMREWKAALEEVSFLNGRELSNIHNRKEGEFARKVSHEVLRELKKRYLAISKHLVIVDNHIDAIMEMIGAGTSETRIIGIHGMGGIGKTTIAKLIYNKLSHNFEHCCFLCDVRETSKNKGIQCLQNQLISDILKTKCIDIKDIDDGTQTIEERLSNKRVLLLLDDVEEGNHIDALVGRRDWLGRGSKIIITTRNKYILDVPEVDCSYELSEMDVDQSLQLFSRHAFRKDYPLDEYIGQSKRAIGIARGLPLALEVIGSLLCRTKKEKWDLTLKKLENVPHATVQSKLKISYDALDVRQQDIFLDIACLFIGYEKDILVYFWDKSKFPEEAMEVLQNLSLIKIGEKNRVWMHDQLRDLGREIVRQESNTKITEQSRVWDGKEGLNLLRKHKGEKKVEALYLELDDQQQYHFSCEGFENLSYLRFLKVGGSMENFCAEERLLWPKVPSNVFPTNATSYLLPQLRWLSWRDIPPPFNITNFSVDDVTILDLSYSKITYDWKGWSHVKVMKNLKVLEMSYCEGLQRIPNFSTLSNLEHLKLKRCHSLIKIDRSICQLTCLVSLNVKHCTIQRLPDELGEGLASLEYLSLKGCSELERLPDSIGSLESLIKLDISWTSIKELPDSIGNLKKLKVLRMCSNKLKKIPDVLWSMGALEEIIAYGGRYKSVDEFSHVRFGNDGICGCQSLRILVLEEVCIHALSKLPESLIVLRMSELHMDTFPDFSNLTNLERMDLEFGEPHHDVISNGLGEHPMPRWLGNGLGEHLMPQWPGNLSKLEFLAPRSHHLPPQLQSLRLECPNLRYLPMFPSSLSFLALTNCKSLCSMENLSNLKKLSSLDIRGTAVAEIQGLGCLENLQELSLFALKQVKILPDLSNLNKLTSLHLGYCYRLVEIQGQLPQFLHSFRVHSCGLLRKLPDLSSLMGKEVSIHNCGNLNEETILDVFWLNPRHFKFVDFRRLRILPDLSNSNELECLQVANCHDLVEIQGELPQSLEVLKISLCSSLWKLPNLSSSTGLRELHIYSCALVEIQGELPQSLEVLDIHSCNSLWKLPNLSSSTGLREVHIYHCALVEIPSKLPQSLEVLDIAACKSLGNLPNLLSSTGLRKVRIVNFQDLVEIQGKLPQSLKKLEISSCRSLQQLPYLSNLIGLREFSIQQCDNLVEIPGELPQSLEVLKIAACKSLRKLPNLSSSTGLREVCIDNLQDLVEIQGKLPQSLEVLKIDSCGSLRKLPNLSSSMGLREVRIGWCDDLVEIEGELPQSLKRISIFYCKSLQKLPYLSSLIGLRGFTIVNCDNLVEIPGELPQCLKTLFLRSCKSLRKLPYLSSLMGLRNLYIKECSNLVEILGELPQSLKLLKINSCKSLWKLPNLSSSTGLREVRIGCCDDLIEIEGELLQSLKVLEINSCISLQKLPNLSSSTGLQKVKIIHCKKINVETITSLCSEMSVKFVEVEDDDSEEDDSEVNVEVYDEYDSEADVEVDDDDEYDSEEDVEVDNDDDSKVDVEVDDGYDSEENE